MAKVTLGQQVRDKISGFDGIAVARTEWLYGCIRITVQPQKLGDKGQVLESGCFDEEQVEITGDGIANVAVGNGPKPDVHRQADPTR